MGGNRLTNEAELLERALTAFHETTGLRLEWKRHEHGVAERRVDAVLGLQQHDLRDGFVAEVRPRINNAVLGTIRNRIEN